MDTRNKRRFTLKAFNVAVIYVTAILAFAIWVVTQPAFRQRFTRSGDLSAWDFVLAIVTSVAFTCVLWFFLKTTIKKKAWLWLRIGQRLAFFGALLVLWKPFYVASVSLLCASIVMGILRSRMLRTIVRESSANLADNHCTKDVGADRG